MIITGIKTIRKREYNFTALYFKGKLTILFV